MPVEARAVRDARGCLTPAGLQALREAPPGRAPAELAAHVASCARCQDRLLAADAGLADRTARRQAPPLWRVFALLGAGLILAVAIFAWASRLIGG
jgi:hypothetical protein